MNKLLTGIVNTILLITLTSCNGSSSEQEKVIAANSDDILLLDQDFYLGQAIELIVYFPNQSISNITWQQSAGTPVNLLTPNSKVLTVTPHEPGDYRFTATFTLNNQQQTLTKSFTVNDEEKPLSVRLGHATVMGNKVSLRSYLTENFSASEITWRQLAGPNVELSFEDNTQLVLFDAPSVTQDSVISLSAEITTEDGSVLEDTVAVLIEQQPLIANNAYFDEAVAKVSSYNPNSPYAQALESCVYNNQLASSCQLNQLPLLASEQTEPTIDQIMDRVLVSHPWMGDRFKQFLQTFDSFGDFRKLLRATTAVVISYDVRPSFYWAATGAIYLDPDDLWLTPEERDTINEAPDYRSDFGNDLRFSIPWRYIKDNDYAFEYYDIRLRQSRSLNELQYPLSYLLYHELAHANDFFPASHWQIYPGNMRILDAALDQEPESEGLAISFPLQSQLLKNLAQVRFAGDSASSSQAALHPDSITQHFAPDSAVHFYSYFTSREDYAMLFEELMMQHRFGIARDVAVTNNPNHQDDNSETLTVNWGMRGRVAAPQIKQRVEYVTERVLPEFELTTALNQLAAPLLMQPNKSWLDNLVLSQGKSSNSIRNVKRRTANASQHFYQRNDYYTKPLPKH